MGKFKKILLIVGILIGAGVLLWGVVWLIGYYQYRTSPQYQAQKYLDEMEKKYREDTYGGSTPEETLNLFIDALKKGDTDLASKYFVVDKQGEWKGNLENVKNANVLNIMIDDLTKAKRTKLENNRALFVITNEKSVVTSIISISKSISNKWKIESL